MANPPGHTSREGYQWTKEGGLQAGVPSLGVIKPATSLPTNAQQETFDAIVIGGGYTGLTAIRDLTAAGLKVLLLEARDRIGGRSWSSNLGGYPYELGGTWVHWHQPFVWRELSRYGLGSKLDVSPVKEGGLNRCLVSSGGKTFDIDHDEEDRISASAIEKFANVDGQYARTVIPFPHDPYFNRAAVEKYDRMSLADRFAEVADDMTPRERLLFEAFLSITCGSQSWEEASFFEFLRWWSLLDYSYTGFIELGLTYKFRHGQSDFARHFFDEAQATGRLAYAFDTVVGSVADGPDGITVTTTARTAGVAGTFRARRIIVTVPLNVLHKVSFSPPLPAASVAVSQQGHVNRLTKIHAELAHPELRSVGAFSWPDGKLTYGFGDGTTPAGHTHMVAFGSSHPGVHLQPEDNVDDTLGAWQNLLGSAGGKNLDIRRVVFHNWHKDEFAEGTWEWLRPGVASKHLETLRERRGNVLFAGSDLALGWRAFIDGAIEDGGRAAQTIIDELRAARASGVPKSHI